MEKDSKLHAGHWQRVRNRALSMDTAKFTDKEMLELTLQYIFTRGDVNEIASRLLSQFKSYAKVLNASKNELMKIKGIGETVAEKIVLLPKIINFYNVSNAKLETNFITCPQHCVKLAQSFLSGLTFERLYMFCINKTGKLIKEIVLGEGEDACVKLSVNEIVLRANDSKASLVVFAHNHPSGKVLPSLEDINFTKRVCQVLYFSGIEVVEHVIIGKNEDYYSFAQSGLIEKFLNDVKKL